VDLIKKAVIIAPKNPVYRKSLSRAYAALKQDKAKAKS
jgi:hypothetical protein